MRRLLKSDGSYDRAAIVARSNFQFVDAKRIGLDWDRAHCLAYVWRQAKEQRAGGVDGRPAPRARCNVRKPIAIEIAAPSGPAHYWAAMKAAGNKGFTVRAIALDSEGVTYETVKRYVWFCVRSGYVAKIREKVDGYATQGVYVVTTPLRKPPIERKNDKRVSGRQAMWNAMRTLSQFSAKDLQICASTEQQPVSRRSAELYIQKLNEAGALVVIEAPARASGKGKSGRPRGATPGLYRLKGAANTGPAAPVLGRAGELFDMNTKRTLSNRRPEMAHGRAGGASSLSRGAET